MHSCVYVFHDDNTDIETLLAPFDENMELDTPIIKWTKEEAIKNCRDDIKNFNEKVYERYLADPTAYEAEYSYNPNQIKYLKEEFPKKLNWTDEECYNYMKDGYETDDEGNILTDYNPNAQWDWYVVGGRWNGTIPNNECLVDDIDVDTIDIPYAFVTTDGKWYDRDLTTDSDDEEWNKKFRDYIKSLDKKIVITQVDCHI